MFNIENPIGHLRFLLLDFLGEVNINKVLKQIRAQQYYSKAHLHTLGEQKIEHLLIILKH